MVDGWGGEVGGFTENLFSSLVKQVSGPALDCKGCGSCPLAICNHRDPRLITALPLGYTFSSQRLGGTSVWAMLAEGAGPGSCLSIASWASSRSWRSDRGQQVISLEICQQVASPGH